MWLGEKLEQLKGKVHLGSVRKQVIKGNLLNIINAKEALRVREDERRSMGRPNIFTNYFKKMTVFAMIAIVALVGGGSSFAAQGALPGDALYPVKVEINEKIHAALQFSTEARARYEAELAAERLEEAAEVTREGRIDAEAKADLEARFQAHADRVEDRIERMRAEGKVEAAADVAAKFETSLRAHAAILGRLEAKAADVEGESNTTATSGVRVQVKPLRVNVENELDNVIRIKAILDADVEADEESKADTNSSSGIQGGTNTNVRGEVKVEGGAKVETRSTSGIRLDL